VWDCQGKGKSKETGVGGTRGGGKAKNAEVSGNALRRRIKRKSGGIFQKTPYRRGGKGGQAKKMFTSSKEKPPSQAKERGRVGNRGRELDWKQTRKEKSPGETSTIHRGEKTRERR